MDLSLRGGAAGGATLGRRCGHGHRGVAERQLGGAEAPSSAANAAAGGAEATCHCERVGGSARRAAQGSVVAAAVGGAEAPHHHERPRRRQEGAVECRERRRLAGAAASERAGALGERHRYARLGGCRRRGRSGGAAPP